MRLLFVLLVAALLSCQTAAAAQPPQIQAEAACLIVSGSQKMLYGKEPDKIMYPASTTKIMTLLIALQKGNLQDIVTVGEQAASCEGSSLELAAGDRIKLRDLLFGLMLVSGNDAAEAIAEHVGGSLDGFVALMNAEASRLGAHKTHFSNPHGLPDDANHFTTARDLAIITENALKRTEFLEYVTTASFEVTLQGTGERRSIANTNKLLKEYPGANGVKTGYTNDAGPCLVASARQGGVQLIAVVLNSEERWQDASRLLDYGFSLAAYK